MLISVVHAGSVADNCLIRNDWICPLYLTTRSGQVLAALQEHVTILLVTLVVSVVLSLPLAVLAHRTAWVRGLVLGTSTVIYTVPSLAMFSLLLPVTGFGPQTVVVALVLYSLTVLVRGLVSGLDAVPASAVDAAVGMGYGRWRLLREVQLPLAVPTAFAGLRIAAVSTVALTTIGFLFDSGGLGNLINQGLTSNFRSEVLTATVLAVVLAFLVDLVLVLVRRVLTPWRRGGGGMSPLVDYITDPATWLGEAALLDRTVEHVGLSALSLLVATLVAVPVGLWLGHVGRGGVVALNIGGVGRAVPTFALLVILVLLPQPFGANVPSYVLALSLFTVPPLLTNTWTGIREADKGAVDAGRGLGMTGWQLLWRVELPIARPLVLSGLRLAAVQVVATTTVVGLVGGGALGRTINTGFVSQDQSVVVVAAVLVAVLALTTELALGAVERRATRRRSGRTARHEAARRSPTPAGR